MHDLEDELYSWFTASRGRNIPISGPMLQENALELAKLKDLNDERGDVDKDTCEDWKKRLQNLLKDYKDEDIYNLDETALFFVHYLIKHYASKEKIAQVVKSRKLD